MDRDIIGLTTQLEMPVECACMRIRHTLDAVYKSIQAPTWIDSIKKLSFSLIIVTNFKEAISGDI